MSDCLFCKIVKGEVPSDKVYENENVLAFKDIYPQAKEHFLFIHKSHTKDIEELIDNDPSQITDIFKAISNFTKEHSLDQNSFRLVNNKGAMAGQSVFHTHFHLLGGEPLKTFGS
jgi:histidine triad (HIT) family protein